MKVLSLLHLPPLINYYSYNIRVKFNGIILRQPKVLYTHEKTVNIYIVYELAGSGPHFDDSTLKNCLFGAVALTKNADIDKYGYSAMELVLIGDHVFHFQVVDLVKMYYFLEQIWVLLPILIIRKETY